MSWGCRGRTRDRTRAGGTRGEKRGGWDGPESEPAGVAEEVFQELDVAQTEPQRQYLVLPVDARPPLQEVVQAPGRPSSPHPPPAGWSHAPVRPQVSYPGVDAHRWHHSHFPCGNSSSWYFSATVLPVTGCERGRSERTHPPRPHPPVPTFVWVRRTAVRPALGGG